MSNDQYKKIEALIYRPEQVKRSKIRVGLRVLGIDNVEEAHNAEQLNELVRAGAPDLLICISDYADEDSLNLIRFVRDGMVAKNPFLSILAANWCSDEETIAALRNAGVDGFLSLPLSPVLIGKFLQTQITQRKKFVASSEYVGPDRRRDPARSGAECFSVVNSLRLRVLGSTAKDIEQQIATATRESIALLDEASQRSNVTRLCIQWRLLERCRAGSPDFMMVLKRLCSTALRIKTRAHRAAMGTGSMGSSTIADANAAMKAIAGFPADGEVPLSAGFYESIERLGEAVFSLAQRIAPECTLPRSSPQLDAIAAKIDIRRKRPEISQISLSQAG
jgi:DNA-binding NarL/FixJ family response regulator